MISSELPEVLRVSHRIAVMAHGLITGVLDNKDATQENIMELATVGKAPGKEPQREHHRHLAQD
ncbi:hypothetical protein [Tessaracoccus coleopterorum]|uniref:hypothetical protein n=1 Tax=Tessaracoccus coleopterorum TaxID=2714950 RepID=UPI001E3E265F|nr:hypothetical protein [Tessaracoccus coleopterorum]